MADDTMLFGALLLSLHAAGMQQMGKILNPLTGKIDRDLEQVQGTIAMMEMLKKKTEGNLTTDEGKLLGRLLYELQMNYVDELNASQKAGTEPDSGSKKNGEAATNNS